MADNRAWLSGVKLLRTSYPHARLDLVQRILRYKNNELSSSFF